MRRGHTKMHTEEGHMIVESEMGVIQLQAKEPKDCPSHQKLEEARRVSPRAFGWNMDLLILDFGCPEFQN
jgi:hypothetical protein